jgi:tetratricopeptide (TPR) repeat protein
LKIPAPPFTFVIKVDNPSFVNAGIPMQLPLAQRNKTVPLKNVFLFALLGSAIILLQAASAQSTPSRQSPARTTDQQPISAEAELDLRVSAAQDARTSGSASTIALANQRLIAFALRELAQLRLLQLAYPQAMELYRRSLDFEDLPDTRVDLAIAELLANHPDDSVAESIRVLAVDPNNARAFNLRGQAWMKKGEYAKAADAFQQAVKLNPDVETFYSLGICLLQVKDAKDK